VTRRTCAAGTPVCIPNDRLRLHFGAAGCFAQLAPPIASVARRAIDRDERPTWIP
jgi:hypothetical protein